jgi:hypothetical protein
MCELNSGKHPAQQLTVQQFSALGSAVAAEGLGTVPGGHTKACQPLRDTSVSAQVGKQLYDRHKSTRHINTDWAFDSVSA